MSTAESQGRHGEGDAPAVTVLIDPDARSLPQDVFDGLTSFQKSVPPKHFYDKSGSELFEQITRLPEYYPTRAELEILETQGARIASLTATRELVELGSGAAEKALLLIDPMLAAGDLERYVPVDVSEAALMESSVAIAGAHPDLVIDVYAADISRQLGELPLASSGRTVALLGGTVGNFRPDQRRELLESMARFAGPEGHVLIGFDKVKDPAVLVAAYDDAAGVTAQFNLNLLSVINRELDADFDPTQFTHVAIWDEANEWIEMRLRSNQVQTVEIKGLDMTVKFESGEDIVTETSAKFTRERVDSDFAASGLVVEEWLEDSESRFALVVAAPS